MTTVKKDASEHRHDEGISIVKTAWSPLGNLLIASEEEYVTGLWFEGQKHFGTTLQNNQREGTNEAIRLTEKWLEIYFKGEIPDFTPPLKLKGTEFRKKVWKALLDISYGQTAAYSDIAAKLGNTSARAVGGAVGLSPISIIVPCHRVIGKNGSLTGYAGGIKKKKELLKMERVKVNEK